MPALLTWSHIIVLLCSFTENKYTQTKHAFALTP